MNHFETYEEAPWTKVVSEDHEIIVYEDGFPVTPGHLLFVPKEHTPELVTEAFSRAYEMGVWAVDTGKCDGFNVGMNNGESAGQTVGWPHVHLILRRTGDTENPKGGVRNVIPGKGDY